MAKKLDPRKIKRNRPQTVKSLAALYDVHPNTVRRWIKHEGLPVLEGDGHEVIMHWRDVRDWIVARNAARKWPKSKPNEMPCLTCKAHMRVEPDTFRIEKTNTQKITLHGICVGCEKPIQRFDVLKNLDLILRAFDQIHRNNARARIAHIGDGITPVKDSL